MPEEICLCGYIYSCENIHRHYHLHICLILMIIFNIVRANQVLERLVPNMIPKRMMSLTTSANQVDYIYIMAM